MQVALVYDRVNKWGGAERVLLALHEMFPRAPLFTSVYSPSGALWSRGISIRPSFLQKIPFAKNHHELFATLMPLAFEQFSFDQYDLVISVTSEAAKGVITKPQTKHICYCLTPTRYLWSGYKEYFSSSTLRTFASPAVKYLKNWDLVGATRPDTFLAISKEVQRRIQHYYRRDSHVIYPPLTLKKPPHSVDSVKGDYFLAVSRLVPYKRIDLAVRACNKLQKRLIVVGTGVEESKLKSIAGPTIRFVSNLTDRELVEYYKGCKALLFPGKEDFGLVIAEALSYGKPVVAYKAGGALEIITHKKTGYFFYPQTEFALIRAIESFEKTTINPDDCRRSSALFSKESFSKQLTEIIDRIL